MRASDAYANALPRVGDRSGDFFDDADKLRILNRTLHTVSSDTLGIRYGQYSPVTEDQSQYGMPDGFLDVDFCFFRYQNESKFYELTPLRPSSSFDVNTGDESSGRPVYYTVYGRSVVERVVAEVVWKSGTGQFSIGKLPTDVKVGDIVENSTDGSQGSIGGITADGQANPNPPPDNIDVVQLEAGLVGGTRANFNVGDTCRITSPDRSRQTIIFTPAPNFSSGIGEEHFFVYSAFTHREITTAQITGRNDILEIDDFLEEAALDKFCYNLSLEKSDVSDTSSQAFEASYQRRRRQNKGRVRSKYRRYRSLWSKLGPPGRYTPYMLSYQTRLSGGTQ